MVPVGGRGRRAAADGLRLLERGGWRITEESQPKFMDLAFGDVEFGRVGAGFTELSNETGDSSAVCLRQVSGETLFLVGIGVDLDRVLSAAMRPVPGCGKVDPGAVDQDPDEVRAGIHAGFGMDAAEGVAAEAERAPAEAWELDLHGAVGAEPAEDSARDRSNECAKEQGMTADGDIEGTAGGSADGCAGCDELMFGEAEAAPDLVGEEVGQNQIRQGPILASMMEQLADAFSELEFAVAHRLLEAGFGALGGLVRRLVRGDRFAFTEGDGIAQEPTELGAGTTESEIPVVAESGDGTFHGGLPFLDDRLGSFEQFDPFLEGGLMGVELAAEVKVTSEHPGPIGAIILVGFLAIQNCDARIAAKPEDFDLLTIGCAHRARGIDDVDHGGALGEGLEDLAFGGKRSLVPVLFEKSGGGLTFDRMVTKPLQGGGWLLETGCIHEEQDGFAVDFDGIGSAADRGARGRPNLGPVVLSERGEDGGFAFVRLAGDDEGGDGGNGKHGKAFREREPVEPEGWNRQETGPVDARPRVAGWRSVVRAVRSRVYR
jgi:hypothetical protein